MSNVYIPLLLAFGIASVALSAHNPVSITEKDHDTPLSQEERIAKMYGLSISTVLHSGVHPGEEDPLTGWEIYGAGLLKPRGMDEVVSHLSNKTRNDNRALLMHAIQRSSNRHQRTMALQSADDFQHGTPIIATGSAWIANRVRDSKMKLLINEQKLRGVVQ